MSWLDLSMGRFMWGRSILKPKSKTKGTKKSKSILSGKRIKTTALLLSISLLGTSCGSQRPFVLNLPKPPRPEVVSEILQKIDSGKITEDDLFLDAEGTLDCFEYIEKLESYFVDGSK